MPPKDQLYNMTNFDIILDRLLKSNNGEVTPLSSCHFLKFEFEFYLKMSNADDDFASSSLFRLSVPCDSVIMHPSLSQVECFSILV